ncbi:Histone-lysine N-methyltransferase set9 [Dissophora globulifera]|uniref:Histone-lysine N-methyltransferase SET9 n=1 Tax=Dissophora globulifera TaxID=979702 RepID=A0A9P6RKP0_9FUNG|nr:Histone-lysine N-methyltransferase set9 [Dissophora globulifera]
MDLQTLSTLDDLLSDILLDGVHLWFQTHKMNKDYTPMRLPAPQILDIIQRKVIVDRKVPEAVKELLEHARRYFNIYLPTAGFEISQTDRYTAVTNKSEACVIANRTFEVGSELRYCAGTIANLNEQEEKDLENRTSDFSVIKTSRRGTCLFLGPARFVNHDCDPNCSFMAAGSTVIYFKVLRQINANDEITTHYGDNYFGINNQECLCATCENRGEGRYKKDRASTIDVPVSPSLKPLDGGSFGRRLRNRGRNVQYYPPLLLSKTVTPKQLRTPPKRTSPPIESDTIPRAGDPLTPMSQAEVDTTSTPPMMTESELEHHTTPPRTIPESDSECPMAPLSMTSEGDSQLVPVASVAQENTFNLSNDLLPLLKENSEHTAPTSGPTMTPSSIPEHDDEQESASTPLSLSDGDSTTDDDVESTLVSSMEQLCATKQADEDTEFSRTHSPDSDFASNDATPDDRVTQQSRIEDGNTSAETTATHDDPVRCDTCRNNIPKHERGPSKDCKRCQRHLFIYNVAWPSRSNHAIAERLQKAEREAAMKLKAEQMALEAERLRKKKRAAEAARRTAAAAAKAAAKAEVKARQARIKEEMRTKTMGRHTALARRFHPHLSMNGVLNGQDDSTFDITTFITEQHPFHKAPYVVFVDPQDNGESRFWWIAVTVPHDQMDSTMPALTTQEDGTVDPDLIVVRFLEDFTYSVCNISGLQLFHPEQDPYRNYVNVFGREFVKNLGVKRALTFMRGGVLPQELPWRNMSCEHQLSLTEVAILTRRIRMQIEGEQCRIQELNEQQARFEAYQQKHELHASSLQEYQHQFALFQQSEELEELRQLQLQQEQDEYEKQAQSLLQGKGSAGTEQTRTGTKKRPPPAELLLLDPAALHNSRSDPLKRKPGLRGVGRKTLNRWIAELRMRQQTQDAESAKLTESAIAELEIRLSQVKPSGRSKSSSEVTVDGGGEEGDAGDDDTDEGPQSEAIASLTLTPPVALPHFGAFSEGMAPAGPKAARSKSAGHKAAKSKSTNPKAAGSNPAGPKPVLLLPAAISDAVPSVELPPLEAIQEPPTTARLRNKSRAKPGSVIWWPREFSVRRPSASLKPRLESEHLKSHRIIAVDARPRFECLSTLLFSSQTPEVIETTVNEEFEMAYSQLEQQILNQFLADAEPDCEARPGDSTVEAGNKSTRVHSVSSKQGALTLGTNTKSLLTPIKTNRRTLMSSDDTLSTLSSAGSSNLSSLMPSVACSVIGEDDQEVDVEGLDILDKDTAQWRSTTGVPAIPSSTEVKAKAKAKAKARPRKKPTVDVAAESPLEDDAAQNKDHSKTKGKGKGKSKSKTKGSDTGSSSHSEIVKKRRLSLDNSTTDSEATEVDESIAQFLHAARAKKSVKPNNNKKKSTSTSTTNNNINASANNENYDNNNVNTNTNTANNSKNSSVATAAAATDERPIRPKPPRSEVEMLFEWTIQYGSLQEGPRTSRMRTNILPKHASQTPTVAPAQQTPLIRHPPLNQRSPLAQRAMPNARVTPTPAPLRPYQPIQPPRRDLGNTTLLSTSSKKMKSELERLSEWTIMNSRLEDSLDINSVQLVTRQGRKRPRAQNEEAEDEATEIEAGMAAAAAVPTKRSRLISNTTASTAAVAVAMEEVPRTILPEGHPATSSVRVIKEPISKQKLNRARAPALVLGSGQTVETERTGTGATEKTALAPRSLLPPSEPIPDVAMSGQDTTVVTNVETQSSEGKDSNSSSSVSSGKRKEVQNLLVWYIKDNSSVDLNLVSSNARTVRQRVPVEREPTQKPSNTVPAKFKVGDFVMAPAEDDQLFEASIRVIREHQTKLEVYEYKVHYEGYASKYDAWVEEGLLVVPDQA